MRFRTVLSQILNGGYSPRNLGHACFSYINEARLWRLIARIEDAGQRNHVWLMSNTILGYAHIFRHLRRHRVTSILEVAPGYASLPAIANATMRNPLRYCAIEKSRKSSARLEEFCALLGLAAEIETRRFDKSAQGSEDTCLVFEHSLEDIYIDLMLSSPQTNNIPPFDLSPQRRVKIERLASLFAKDFLDNIFKSQFGALVFHHFQLPTLDVNDRHTIDPVIAKSIAEQDSASPANGWVTVPIDFQTTLAHEVWAVYRRKQIEP